MPINKLYLAEFEESSIYHVYNRTNNKELLFCSDAHRVYFLQRYAELVSPFADTFCYNLLPNHFHFMIRTKSADQIATFLEAQFAPPLTITEKKFLKDRSIIYILLKNVFKRFFQSYAQSFNAEQSRKGNLFSRPFKRVLIESDAQFTQTIIYIHANALKHKITKDFTKYKWSSWESILSNKRTNLLRDEVLEWFGGRGNFVKTHLESAEYYYFDDIEEYED